MIPNTQHLPGISSGMSSGDLAAEEFRARSSSPRRITEVPEHLRDRYPTLESYLEALHDFLNGN